MSTVLCVKLCLGDKSTSLKSRICEQFYQFNGHKYVRHMIFRILQPDKMGDRKHLQYAIMKYLEDEAKDMSEDQRENLEGILL